MFKRIVAVIGTVMAVSLVGLFVVGSAFAQGPTPPPTTAPQTPWGHAWGRVCDGAGVVSDVISKLLGMTPEQIYAERQAGKTLSDLAKAKGISDQQLIDAITAGRQGVIDQAVKDGRITQTQADWLLSKMKAMAPFMLTNPFGPGGTGGFGHGGMGMRGGGPGRWGGTAPWATPQVPTQ